METSYIHIIKELSVPEVIDFIDRNIESFSTDDLAKLRDAVISVIYESNNIEESASIITTHLLKQFRQADLRIKGKYDVARNEMLGNKYLSLCVSCLEKMPHLYFSLDEDSIRILEDLGYTQKDEKQNQPQDTSEGTGKKPELKNNTQKKREKKYFAKAIEAGLMEKDGDSYRWLHNDGLKASLAYFLKRVFNPKGTAQISYQRLEVLFGVTRLDTALDQALTVKKPQKWRTEIDNLFDD